MNIKEMLEELEGKVNSFTRQLKDGYFSEVINEITGIKELRKYIDEQTDFINEALSIAESGMSKEYELEQIKRSMNLTITPAQNPQPTTAPVKQPHKKLSGKLNKGQNQTRPAQAAAPNQAQAAPTGQPAASAAPAANPPATPATTPPVAPANAQPTPAANATNPPAASTKPEPLYKRVARYFIE